MKTLFSGIQPTGNLHLGNYLGAIKNWVELQKKYNCIFSIVDLHALSSNITAQEIRKNIFDLAVDLIALGIDPKKSILFQQSKVAEHTELAWIFNCITPVSELERMTQFKDKAKEQSSNINAGLFDYPVLQAADILLYKAEAVPVGEDQIQHVELTRIIAKKFNNRFGQYFPEAQAVLSPAKRVMSLNNPDKKMSKSLGEASYIAIRDSRDTISKKIKKAVSDEQGTKNLLELYSYFGDKKKHTQMTKDFSARKLMNSQLKDELTISVLKFLEPIQKKILILEKNPAKVNKILDDGAKRAQKIASKNMSTIRKLIGIR
ncbi:tryptophan--tRNA ligase [Patescibacteria group bacterium]|nr:tryptophan--tRNA ligase [Patescibacteria group bacterium]